jgi:OOP family OmpA-OmpF porin
MSQISSSNASTDSGLTSLTDTQIKQLKTLLFTEAEIAVLGAPAKNRTELDDPELERLRQLLFPQEELRRLLLVEDYQKLKTLLAWLEQHQQDPKKLAQVLPQALEELSQNSSRLTHILAPQIEKSLHSSVNKNPQPLIDSLFPIIGPMIRKSISETLSDMLKSINQLVDQSFSISALRWRIEARRTGKSYAEVALLRSLDYQVDQIFLIHQETGILLEHLTSPESLHKDGDMVSGMLTAVQDFVTDAFSINDGSYLSELKLGDFTLILEKGPKASIVAAILGKPPASIRVELQQKLEFLHRDYHDEFNQFKGDTTPFDSAIEDLSTLLVRKKHQKKKPILRWIVISLTLLSLLSYASYNSWLSYQHHQAWSNLIIKLNQQPGIVVTNERDNQIQGLADPLIGDVKSYALKHKLINSENPILDSIQWQFKPYISIEPQIIEQRIQRNLILPEGVQYQYKNGVLSLQGKTTTQWLQNNQAKLYSIHGVTEIDHSALTFIDLEAEQQRLKQLRELRLAEEALQTTLNKIKSFKVYFDIAKAQLTNEHIQLLTTLEPEFTKLMSLTNQLNRHAEITVIGNIDTTSGSLTLNTKLAQQRANAVLTELQKLVPGSNIKISTSLITSALQSKTSEAINLRHVTLNVKVTPNP